MDDTLLAWLLDPFTTFSEAEKMASRPREVENPEGEGSGVRRPLPRRARSPYGPDVPPPGNFEAVQGERSP